MLLTLLNQQFSGILKQTVHSFLQPRFIALSILDREVRHARAGHPSPLRASRRRRRQTPRVFQDSAGPALGLIEHARYNTSSTQLAPGDVLLLFTDGVVEVEAESGGQFGLDGLCRSVQSALNQPTRVLLDAIVDQVCSFAGSRVFLDDVCLVAAELP